VLTGTQKMKTKKTLALQAKINTLAKRFEDDEIDRAEYLQDNITIVIIQFLRSII
jgi:hypothetical protein